MSKANQHIGEKMTRASELITADTLEFYKGINFSGASRN